MPNRDVDISREYEGLVVNRGIDHYALVPPEHEINWGDQPSRYKIYNDVLRLPLSLCAPDRLGSLADVLRETAPLRHDAPLTYEELSTLLLLTNGIFERKLDVNWSQEHSSLVQYAHASYARPTASGGGMYPFELYVVTGRGGALLPGVYHYDNAHHALERLSVGDVSSRVRAATFDSLPEGATSFILISLNFWKNYFKYHNFCYHVVTQDIGAALGSLRLITSSLGRETSFSLWFHDEELNRVLGLETDRESVFGVVAFEGRASHQKSSNGNGHGLPEQSKSFGWLESRLNEKTSFQRSRYIFDLPLVQRVHQASLVTDENRPGASDVAGAHCEQLPADGPKLPLPRPTPELLDRHLLEVFMERSSSWGKMTSQPALEFEKLATLLRFAAASGNYSSDVKAQSPETRFTRLMLFANHVAGVPAGIYAYDESEDCLQTLREVDLSIVLQRMYFLHNYNLEQAACLLAIVGETERMLHTFGNRGLRIRNAEAGLIAQNIYMASAAMSLGCGAILGFENIAINQFLGLEGTGQTTLLLLLVGPQRDGYGRFDYRLLPVKAG
ncbi:MAG TPA: SagB family peptide dehydrogenase [Pyrinomonadaceae bacterium]|jgi:SagB-type dehydrogenase family enzyme